MDIKIDVASAGLVETLVVPVAVQQPNVIVGRSWLDTTTVAYYKKGNQLHPNHAEHMSETTEIAATALRKDCDYLNVVKAKQEPIREQLVPEDFVYVYLET